ncbi:TPR domain protein [Aphelenchoides avenae]|nr:TPR domain protein [Aphelenchus avenae]
MGERKIYEGHFLFCEVLKNRGTRPAIYDEMVVIDTNGDPSIVGLGFVTCAFGEVFSEGTILAIKEPNKTRNPAPVVTSPSDIVLLDETDGPMLEKLGLRAFYTPDSRLVEELRLDGNKRFASNDFRGALIDYERALRLQPDAAVLHLNKSAALLKMERFYEAYHAADKALQGGAGREKALFRLGQAAYGLRRWQASVDHFLMLRKEFPTNKDGRDGLAKALDRLKESTTGKYDVKRLHADAFEQKARLIDAANWMGPIEVVDILGRGKGIFAREDITTGTLLIVSKAIACSGANDFSDYELCADDTPEESAMRRNKIRLVQTLRRNPQWTRDVYSFTLAISRREMKRFLKRRRSI